jgi:DNA-binding transcriptional LysR family regulator
MNMLNEIDLGRVDLNLLVVFEAVFRERHVANAAKRLHVSPSAVSHGLGRLRALFDDPLFLRTPKGVLPTARANAVSISVSEILSRVRGVIGSVASFEPALSARRFVVGAPDAITSVVLPRLMSLLRCEAPRIDLSFRHLLPQMVTAELDAGTIDLALTPFDDSVPVRFVTERIFDEEFVIAARLGHPFLASPSLGRYCAALHVLVSISGDQSGHVDSVLAESGLSRRVALSVPNFMLALAALPGSDLLAAVPSSLVAVHGARFGIGSVKSPLALARWPMGAVVPKVALMDPGVTWLKDVLLRTATAELGERAGGPAPRTPARSRTTANARARRRGPRGDRR